MDDSKNSDSHHSQYVPEVRRGIYATLTIYEVEESELDVLAKGSPDSLFLTFSIFLITMATSFLIALLTAQVTAKTFVVFVLLTVVGFVVGLILLALWFKRRKGVPDLVSKIKKRLPPEHPIDSSKG